MADHLRAKKSGLGAEIEKKMEARYDQEEQLGTPAAVCKWLNEVLGADHPKCPSSSQTDLHHHLMDGVALCKLINKLLEADGKPKISFQKKCPSPFVAMANIEHFSNGCEAYGLNKEALFQSADLWEGRKGPFLNVINGIHSLGFLANSKSFMPAYTGEQTKFLDTE